MSLSDQKYVRYMSICSLGMKNYVMSFLNNNKKKKPSIFVNWNYYALHKFHFIDNPAVMPLEAEPRESKDDTE